MGASFQSQRCHDSERGRGWGAPSRTRAERGVGPGYGDGAASCGVGGTHDDNCLCELTFHESGETLCC